MKVARNAAAEFLSSGRLPYDKQATERGDIGFGEMSGDSNAAATKGVDGIITRLPRVCCSWGRDNDLVRKLILCREQLREYYESLQYASSTGTVRYLTYHDCVCRPVRVRPLPVSLNGTMITMVGITVLLVLVYVTPSYQPGE